MCLRAKILFFALLPLVAVGCSSAVVESSFFQSYSIGATHTETVGNAFLVDQDGAVETRKTWVGLLYSEDGYKTETIYSRDFLRRELIYSGRSGTTVEVAYREFRGGYAAPAFSQNLKYDLRESDVISFQEFRIRILEATNNSITYQVVSDTGDQN